jgi:ketosteroid isomerase-like protein
MMKILTCALALACCGALAAAESTSETILAMERRAMDGWGQGNPDEFLKISDPEITFFHSTLEKRLEGLAAVKALYEGYRGRPLFDRYEMADPKVVASGDVAVLTYLFTTENGTLTRRWHATEVYRKGPSGWRILHSHFSLAAS